MTGLRAVLRLAWLEAWRRPAHAALLVTAVALGTALVTAIQAVNDSTLAGLRETMTLIGGEAQLQVRARGGNVPEDLVEQVRADPGVAHASGLVSGTLWVSGGPANGETLSVFGVDLGDDAAVRSYRVVERPGAQAVADPLAFLAQPDSVLLTEALMARFGLAVDDKVPVIAPTGATALTVRGALAPEGAGRLFGGSLAVMDLFAAQQLLSRADAVDQIDIVVADGSDVEAVKQRLRAVLPASVELTAPQQRGAETERTLKAFQALLGGISTLGLLFGAFVSYNVAGTAVAMRLREIGALRCLGTSRRQIRTMVVAETALPALVGSAIGIGLGGLLAQELCKPLAATLSYAIRVALPVEGARVPLSAVPLALAAGVGAALVGALGPAAAAARMSPRDVGRDAPGFHAGRLARFGIGALLLGGACFAAAVARESGLLANLSMLLLNGALVLGALAVLPGLGAWLQPVLASSGSYGRVAGDSLVRAPLRAAITVAVITMALTVTLTIGAVVNSFKESLLDFLRASVGADLVVASPFRVEAWVTAPMAQAVADEIGGVAGVERTAFERFATLEQDGESITLRAVSGAFFQESRFGHPLFRAGEPRDALAAVASGRGVLVSDSLARRHGLGVGSSYTLSAPDGPLALTVAGVVTDWASEVGTVTLSRETYVEHWRDTLVNNVFVLVTKGAAVDETRSAITRRLADHFPVNATTSGEFRDRFERELDGVFGFLGALRMAVIVLAALGVGDTLLGLGLARARELGVLRAIGARRRGIYGLFALEALVPAGLGVTFGLLGAVALSAVWVRFLTYQLGWRLDLHVPFAQYAALAVVTWALCGLAALLPIAGLARRKPASLLAYE